MLKKRKKNLRGRSKGPSNLRGVGNLFNLKKGFESKD